jgi:hypothetical protein
MKNFIRKNWLIIIFLATGALSGFLYWRYVGCQSGTCAITSHWYTSVFFGTLAGYLLGDIGKGIQKKRENL